MILEFCSSILLTAAMQVPQAPVRPPLEHLVGGTDPSRSFTMKDCGAYCVAIVGSRCRGERVAFATAQESVDPEKDGLCTMGDLVRGLGDLGIAAVPLQTEPVEIPPGTNILHVRSSPASGSPDHFIVSEELDDGTFRFYAPPLGTRTGDGEAVRRMWGGRFVHIGESESPVWSWLVRSASVLLGGIVLVRLLRRPRRAS